MRQGSADLEERGATARVKIDLDGSGRADVVSGSAFLDHMVAALCRTAHLNLEARAEGSQLYRCTALGRAIGQAIKDALGDQRGIRRYGNSAVPMDDALAEIALDFSGRTYLVFRGEFSGLKIGDLETYEVKAFVEALSDGARLTLHMRFYGENDHHKAESIFKALGLAMREAIQIEGTEIPSTKGII